MKNLVIGNTSQLSHFFPDSYEKISSRDLDLNYLRYNKWDSVYLTFAEQRTSMDDLDFLTPNFIYTRDVLENLVGSSNRIVIYGTCELWNNKIGEIYLEDEFNYTFNNDYVLSKEKLIKYIWDRRKNGWWKNVIIIQPFNFNSTYRTQDFLFGKIFDSIINKKKIEIGDTYFYRDMVHTRYVVEKSIYAKKDDLIGSGRLYFVNDFIRDLYDHFGMIYEDYVTENIDKKARHSEKLFYSYQKEIYPYAMLMLDTIDDIEKRISEK